MNADPRRIPVVTNQSRVIYSSAEGTSGVAYSNTVNTPVTGPVFSLEKNADSTSVSLGETLVYRIVVRNTGNASAAATLYDALPEGLTFIPNSVLRDGVPLPGTSPVSGIPLDTLQRETKVAVLFQAMVVSLPENLIFVNRAELVYQFTTPEGRSISGALLSNEAAVDVQSHLLALLLKVSTPVSFRGDILTYTLLMQNDGNYPLTQLTAVIPIPPGSSFVPGSVIADGVYYYDADPLAGVELGGLAAGAGAEVSFRVQVANVTGQNELLNTASVTYYVGHVGQAGQAGLQLLYAESNTTVVTLIQPQISLEKNVSLPSAVPGDQLQYQITVRNTSQIAVDAVVQDALPSGTLFVWDSVRLNSSPLYGANPSTGIAVGTLLAGRAAVVQFQAAIPESTDVHKTPILANQASLQYTYLIPDGRIVKQKSRSNQAETALFSPDISLTLTPDTDVVEPGDCVKVDGILINSGNIAAEVTLFGLAPNGTHIDPSSIRVNGTLLPSGTPDTGYALGMVQPGETMNIRYVVRISGRLLARSIRAFGDVRYSFSVDGRIYSGQVQSNTYTLYLEELSE
ncbi:DUF11 domain-containing protein [Paenibacillus pinistramenti]|uniref:DUF11 domain-containing protein n=1 Tax=Paenibacillus pinistramenti TaxID=1768003 RepID=UPI00110844C9|nr:DUF11 domain-containing protein [Paenibacillus pinistramenti]